MINYPILKADFSPNPKLGLGILKDVIECKVTEERNASFYLEMKYKNKGDIVKEIKVGRIIQAYAGAQLKNQMFRIYDVKKDIKGNIDISAEHIYFDLDKIQVWQHKRNNVTVLEALKGVLFSQSVFSHQFSATTDIKETISVSFGFQSITECLLGTDGSILDSLSTTFELIRDNQTIKLMKSRGKVRNTFLSYRQNIDGFTCIENKDYAYTHIFPYAYTGVENSDGSKQFVICDERVFKIRNYKDEAVNIFMRDFTDDPYWQNYAMDKINLGIFAKRHAQKMAKESPFKYEVDLSKIKLKTEQELREIGIGDQFRLYNDMYNITTVVKVTELTVDSLTGTPLSVVLEQQV